MNRKFETKLEAVEYIKNYFVGRKEAKGKNGVARVSSIVLGFDGQNNLVTKYTNCGESLYSVSESYFTSVLNAEPKIEVAF